MSAEFRTQATIRTADSSYSLKKRKGEDDLYSFR